MNKRIAKKIIKRSNIEALFDPPFFKRFYPQYKYNIAICKVSMKWWAKDVNRNKNKEICKAFIKVIRKNNLPIAICQVKKAFGIHPTKITSKDHHILVNNLSKNYDI